MKRSIFDIKIEDEYIKHKSDMDINEVDSMGRACNLNCVSACF
jgi:hypothetical protein